MTSPYENMRTRDLLGNPIPNDPPRTKPDLPVAEPVRKCAGYSYWHTFISVGGDTIAQVYGDDEAQAQARADFFLRALHPSEAA